MKINKKRINRKCVKILIFKRNNRLVYTLLNTAVIIFLFSLAAPILFTLHGKIDFSKTGQIGDTIGGIMSPFIALVAAIITFLAFWVQYIANKKQWEEIKKQNTKDKIQSTYDRIDKFENHFFTMMDYHKQILNSMHIKNNDNKIAQEGVDCFPEILKLFNKNWITLKIDGSAPLPFKKNDSFKKLISNDKEEAILKYLAIYYGKLLLTEKCFNKYKHCFSNNDLFSALSTNKISIHYTFYINNGYYMNNGYSVLLGHYFRSLFQIIKYVDSFSYGGIENVLELSELEFKYKYIKILRSNLTNNEQILLFYNCLTPFGKEWKDRNEKSFFDKYKIIKNIPLPMIVGYSPLDWYKSELGVTDQDELKKCFEWYDS